MNRLDTFWQKIKGLQKVKARFPEDYTDIHSHILPGLDDGSADMDTTKNLLLKMKEIGITSFVFTPHVMEGVWENTSEGILERLEKVKSALTAEEWSGFHIRASAEYMLDDGFTDLLSKRDLLPIAANFILVEMSFMEQPLNIFEILAQIQIAGYRPIMAHPERYFYLHGDMGEYEKLKGAGCYFQLNLLSLSSWYGEDVKKMAGKLLQKGWYDFVGSDAHHHRHVAKLNDLTTRKRFWNKVNPVLDIQRQWMEGGENF